MVSFSIIIPVYNRASLIDRTLASILEQDLSQDLIRDLEIIVVDDGSTDGTRAKLEQYGDRLKILQQVNQGPGAARNLGITAATGDYILFLDSDDLWFSWSIATFKQAILQFNYPTFVGGKGVEFVDASEPSKIAATPFKAEFFPDYYAAGDRSLWLLNGAVAIKTEVLRQVGGYNSQWINGEDSDLWLKLGTAEHFVSIESPCVLAYYQHAASAVRDQQKTYQGAWHMIHQEQAGLYPGGKDRQQARRQIIMGHIRPVSLAYLRAGKIKAAWNMYHATFSWNFALGRFIYLIAFWFILTKKFLKQKLEQKLIKGNSY
ncbi:MAG: glycosyltransferase family 2 protein [Waterburya sp.]